MKIHSNLMKECCLSNARYGINSPAYAFPFEEDPRKIIEYKERLNLERVLTVASGGGIPLLIFLELGAKRVDVVDISKNSLALAALRLGAAMDGKHSLFSRFIYTDHRKFVSLAERVMTLCPEIAEIIRKLDVDIYSLVGSSIKPTDGSFLEYFTEYEMKEVNVNFILSDISCINPLAHTTIFLSNVLSYTFPGMKNFIMGISDSSTVIYTIASVPKIFVFDGKKLKEKFLILYQL